ncbi:MAG: AsmA-like C-terminal region-containing protein [bacterium]|nr:AsmA-like C-terminal region-containing protein [bacterium]
MKFRKLGADGLRGSRPPTPPPPGAPPPSPAGRWRWGRFLFRSSVRLTVAAVLALGALVVFGVFHPWSLPWLDRRIRTQWRQGTGLALDFDQARFRLSTGGVDFRQVRLIDPATSQTLVQAPRLALDLPFMQFLQGRPPYTVESIDVRGPLTVEVAALEGRPVLAGGWGRVLEIIEAHRAEPVDRKAGLVRIGQINVRPLAVDWIGQPTPGALPFTSVGNSSLHLEFNRQLQPALLLLDGYLNGRRDKPVRLRVQADWPRRSASLQFSLENPDSASDLPARLPFDVRGAVLDLKAQLELSGSRGWTIQGLLALERLSLVEPDKSGQNLGNLRLDWQATLDRSAGLWRLERADAIGGLGLLQVRGAISAAAPHGYELDVTRLDLQGPAMELLAGRLPHPGRMLHPSKARASLALRLRGDLQTRRPASLTGEVKVSGVDWQLAALPAPVSGVEVDAVLTTGTLEIAHARGAFEGFPLEMRGRIFGQPLLGAFDKAEIDWRTAGPLKDLAAVLRNEGIIGIRAELAGDVTGTGKITLHGPFDSNLNNVQDRIELAGDLYVKGGRLTDPERLPAPIEDVSGRVTFDTGQARLASISARFMGMDAMVDGAIAGEKLFWRNPRVDLQPRVEFDLPALRRAAVAFSPALAREAAGWPDAAGHGRLKMRLTAGPADWRNPRFAGELTLSKASATFANRYFNGPLNLDTARFSFDQAKIRLESLTGRFGKLACEASGEASPGGVTSKASLEGTLAECKARVPILLERFIVDGTGRVVHRTRLAPATPPGVGRTLLDWWRAAESARPAGAPPGHWLAGRWALAIDGDIHLSDAEMTYHTMPSYLRHITGDFKYDLKHLWNPEPIPVEAGQGSRDQMGKIDLIYDRARPAGAFNFEVIGGDFPLGEWLRRWKVEEKVKEPSAPFNPDLPPVFTIHGTARTRTVTFDQLKGADFASVLDVAFYDNQGCRLNCSDVRADLYTGSGACEGMMTDDGADFTVKLDKVELPPFIQALTKKSEVHGIFSGRASGEGSFSKPRRPEGSPLAGAGTLHIVESRFVANSILHGLGGVLRLPGVGAVFDDITFSTIDGPFEVRDAQASTTGLVFENPVMNLNMKGTMGPERRLDLEIGLQFLRIADKIPLVGEAVNLVNQLVGRVLRFKVRGTMDKPEVALL